MELHALHNVFDFFLILYAGYYISPEKGMKEWLEDKLINSITQFGNKYLEKSDELNLLVDNAIVTYKILCAEIVDEKTKIDIISFNKDKIESLKNLKENQNKEGSTQTSLPDIYKKDSIFYNILKPYSLFFALYSFSLLFINSIPELFPIHKFYCALNLFNILSFIFVAAIFLISVLSNRKIVLNIDWLQRGLSRMGSSIIFTIFCIFIAITLIYSFLIPYEWGVWVSNFSIVSCVLLLISPIFFYIIRIPVTRNSSEKNLEKHFEGKRKQVNSIKTEIHDFANSYKQVKNINQSDSSDDDADVLAKFVKKSTASHLEESKDAKKAE
jgi:hypothetical protein